MTVKYPKKGLAWMTITAIRVRNKNLSTLPLSDPGLSFLLSLTQIL